MPAIGAYAYTAPVTALKTDDDRWVVHYDPRTIHPRLTATTRLGTSTEAPARAGHSCDRDGPPLVAPRQVVRVGLQRDKVTDVDASATALATALDVDKDALATALKSAGPKQFVEATDAAQVRLRHDQGRPRRHRRAARGGRHGTAGADPHLRPRAARRRRAGDLGGAGQAAGRRAAGSRSVSGACSRSSRSNWRGVAERRIVIRDSETREPVRTLKTLKGRKPKALRTTLDRDTQEAAESALERHRHGSRGRRRAAVDRGHPGRRQPADGLDVRPRAGLRVRPGLDLQGDHHRRTPARRGSTPPATSPVRRRWSSTARRSRTSKARRRAPPASPTTSRSRATPHSSRSATGCRRTRWGRSRRTTASGAATSCRSPGPARRSPRARTRSAAPRR